MASAGDGSNGRLASGHDQALDIALDALSLEQQHPRASFLGLPVELRLRIYEHIPSTATATSSTKRQARDFAILRTSWQVFHEALPVLYSIPLVSASTLKHLPTYARDHVRIVRVEGVNLECLSHYGDNNSRAWMEWTCYPALTQKYGHTVKFWSLDGMWRYLDRTVPNVHTVRLEVGSRWVSPASLKFAAHGDRHTTALEKPLPVRLLELREVVLSSSLCSTYYDFVGIKGLLTRLEAKVRTTQGGEEFKGCV